MKKVADKGLKWCVALPIISDTHNLRWVEQYEWCSSNIERYNYRNWDWEELRIFYNTNNTIVWYFSRKYQAMQFELVFG